MISVRVFALVYARQEVAMCMKKMRIFEYAQEHPEEPLAVTDDKETIRYVELNEHSKELEKTVGHRLVFVLCRNTPGSLLGYLGLLQSGGVPLLLDADIAPSLLADLVKTYRPAFCLIPEDLTEESRAVVGMPLAESKVIKPLETGNEELESSVKTARLLKTVKMESVEPLGNGLRIRDYLLVKSAPEGKDPQLAPQLRLLLATSGSTGSSKLVRISGENLDANAESIVEYLQISRNEKPITVLPMQYSYGMSIIHSHLMVGAPILLTRYTLMEKQFWERMRDEQATSLCGVPYTFEIYRRVGLMEMDLPALHTITQAGGKLSEERHMQFAMWSAAKGIRFYVMYGQTEASPRMGWLPPETAIKKCGSMGIAIPGGKLDLIDENGKKIPARRNSAMNKSENVNSRGLSGQAKEKKGEAGVDWMSPVGELVYTGANVALGYALCAEDLKKGDEFHGVLYTGDMARKDADGFFYIVGRRSRFIKMVGKRVGLDEVEKILRTEFPGLDLVCTGKDEALHVYVAVGDHERADDDETVKEGMTAAVLINEKIVDEMRMYIEKMTGIPGRRVQIIPVREIPRSSSGKIHYADLK